MNTIDELRLRSPVSVGEMLRIEGPLPTSILVERAIAELAQLELEENQGFFEKLGRQLGIVRTQPRWEGWSGWGATYQLKCAALHLAGWTYDESHYPYEQASLAYERVRRALLSTECRSAQDLLRLLQ